MRQTLKILILTMLFGQFGCKEKRNKDFVFEEFKTQIENQGMKIDSVDETGLLYIKKGSWKLEVSLENVRRNYERDQDIEHISDLVETLIKFSDEKPKNWTEVKKDIYISFLPNDVDLNEIIQQKVTDIFSKVYVYTGQNKFSFIQKDDLKKWNISESDIEIQANENADKLLTETNIVFDTIENHILGLIEVEFTALKGTLLFAPIMKEKIKKDIGYPFYAVLPVRDFCYIFSEKDFDFFSRRIGSVVVDEYKKSGYPITTEILKFTDKGIEAVGKYPVE